MKTIFNWKKEATITDLLNSDAFEEKLFAVFDGSSDEVEVMDRRQFFNSVYAHVVDGKLYKVNQGNKSKLNYNDWIKELKDLSNSEIYFIEGYAGCGKSTFVQRILYDVLEDINYNYNYYNYNIGAYIGNEKANLIKDAIVTCCLKQIARIINQGKESIVVQFIESLSAAEIVHFDSDGLLYQIFSGKMYSNALNELKSGKIDESKFVSKFRHAFKNIILFHALAMDYLLRLSIYCCEDYEKNMSKMIYVCYDNLDSVEDFSMLKEFNNSVLSILTNLNKYLRDVSANLFSLSGKRVPVPKFVTFITYRKVTVARVELDRHNELLDDLSSTRQFVNFIDASDIFNFKDIVNNKYKFYTEFFKFKKIDARVLLKDLKLCVDLFQMDFMNRSYAGLWNHNYRSCSLFIEQLFKHHKAHLKKAVELQKKSDGHENDYEFDYGASAVFLNIICRMFTKCGLWNDEHLALTDVRQEADNTQHGKLTSLSRLILTYVLNTYSSELRPVSTKELFEHFCSIYSGEEICNCLFNMLYRSEPVVWRRPLYYWKHAILKDESISQELKNQWNAFEKKRKAKYTEFMISDCGKAFIQAVSTQFEFYSIRSGNTMPLYFINDIDNIDNTIDFVCESVNRCCEKMKTFNTLYMQAHKLTSNDYLKDRIHPTTHGNSPQMQMERVIFAHILFINRRRLDLFNEYQIEGSDTANSQKELANTRLLLQIEKYLNMYDKYIRKYDTRRISIADVLREKVDQSKASDDDTIKYQSISIT